MINVQLRKAVGDVLSMMPMSRNLAVRQKTGSSKRMSVQIETIRRVCPARAFRNSAIGLPICGLRNPLPPGTMSVSKGGAFLKLFCGAKTSTFHSATNSRRDNPIVITS